MIKIKGEFNEAEIFTNKIDSGTEGLIKKFVNSPVSEGTKIKFMPDVHASKGSVVGSVIHFKDKFIPGFLGTDIGCGIRAVKFRTEIPIDLNKIDKFIHQNIPSGEQIYDEPLRNLNDIEDSLHSAVSINIDRVRRSLGTLGGGNHFIEIDKDDDGSYWLIVHTGSRYLGSCIENFYHNKATYYSEKNIPYEFAYLEGELLDNYLNDVMVAQTYAFINREIITSRIFREIKKFKFTIEFEMDQPHNFVDVLFPGVSRETILRKGAIKMFNNTTCIIPMNMRDGCLICSGTNRIEEWRCSAPHGAGRLMNRAEAKNSFTLTQYKKEMEGIFSTCISRDTIDESPMAYKPMANIIEQFDGIINVDKIIKPIYNFKAGGGK